MPGLERIGWSEIENGLRLFKQPYFALFECNSGGRKDTLGRLLYSYTGDDRQGEGEPELKDNLTVLEATAPEVPHIIQFYDDLSKGSITPNTPYSGSFKLRMKPYVYQGSTSIAGVAGAADINFLTYLQAEIRLKDEKIAQLEYEVADLEADIEELEKLKAEPIDGILGSIGEAGNRFPWLADLMKDGLTMLKHNFGARQRQYADPGGIGNVATDAPPDVLIKDAIRRLTAWYAKEYPDAGPAQQPGFNQFAADMQALAALTADNDVMHLALKKLRNF